MNSLSNTFARSNRAYRTALAVAALAVTAAACSGDDGGSCEEPVNRDTFPAGPYGGAEGQTMDNVLLFEPFGSNIDLQSYRESGARIMLLSTASGWCAACIEEQPTLQAWHEEYGAQGLVVVVTVFEDSDFEPVELSYASEWATQYDLTFDVLADPEFRMSAFYNADATPLNMLIDLDTMEVLYAQTGSVNANVEAVIQSRTCQGQ